VSSRDRLRQIVDHDRLGLLVGGPARPALLEARLIVVGVVIQGRVVRGVHQRVQSRVPMAVPLHPQVGVMVVATQGIQEASEALGRDPSLQLRHLLAAPLIDQAASRWITVCQPRSLLGGHETSLKAS
jgi:hypothetical protein